MMRGWKSILAGLLALLGCAVAGEAVAGMLAPAEQNRLISLLDRRPMVFFVAKGSADSCGKGCNEWIAAVGSFDSEAPERFRNLVEKLGGKSLPVFFHSPGGLTGSGARVGIILRERRMTAAVGRTEPTCRVFDKKDKVCQAKIAAGEPLAARLTVVDASCFSSCVEAFAGASSRRVAAAAHIGVHAARMTASQKELQVLIGKTQVKAHTGTMAEFLQLARRYYVEMGVSPDLPDLASKIPHQRIHVLDLGEIARFGLETRGDSYATPWITTQLPDKNGFVATKSITQRASENAAESLTTRFSLICSADRQVLLGYRRDLPRDPQQATALTRLSFDQWFVDFLVIKTADGAETGAFASNLNQDTLEKFATAKTLIVSEKMKTAEQKPIESSFSNSGLEMVAADFRKRCMSDKQSKDVFGPGWMVPANLAPSAPPDVPVRSVPVKRQQ